MLWRNTIRNIRLSSQILVKFWANIKALGEMRNRLRVLKRVGIPPYCK